MKNYVSRNGVLFRDDADYKFNYSDGAVENHIYDIVRRAEDVSVGSDELASHCKDWPTTYHFSRSRSCLLRPLEEALIGKRILEIGAGCGAISSYLCEVAESVVAIEGSPRRAGIAAERTKNHSNISIICDNFDEVELDSDFDVVLLIGVLEYSPAFVRGQDPAAEMIKKCSRYLAATGKLIVAIENKLGLKYFAGAPEDHLSKVNYGIYDLYHDKEVRTFGKHELEKKLSQEFQGVDFYYPFPDYKLPKLVISQHAFDEGDSQLLDCVKNLLEMGQSEKQGVRFKRQFSEALSFSALVDNGILGDLSNSFLVVAEKMPVDKSKASPIAWTFSTNRRKCFNKVNQFYASDSGVKVKTDYIYEMERVREPVFFHALPPSEFVNGSSYCQEVYRQWAQGQSSAQDIIQWAKPWCDLLGGLSFTRGEIRYLDGKYWDLIPANVMVEEGAKTLKYFDQEWCVEGGFRLAFLIIRGIKVTYERTPGPIPKPDREQVNMALGLLLKLYCGCEISDVSAGWTRMTKAFHSFVAE